MGVGVSSTIVRVYTLIVYLYIELHEAPKPFSRIVNTTQLVVVQSLHVPDVAQPVLHQPKVDIAHGGLDATTTVVAQYDDVTHF